ncbi:TetR/AcrR family transcriptional regulator [Novosphingobium sp. JCM 18896]|uniref:TetR/AcrR family transcriptional regulator n=1 Tax=Novosphingobium sp. JCM 18896 TaxID=2989731 RepID=UPI0022238B55|nr:TetR/AcrR family transcriptional regulator [Novosphingobium sp. JCM 18896]MCW1432328.1 TetR/AcrR family transcriptional regulator [Novosphingobium sp. JCM 18896]
MSREDRARQLRAAAAGVLAERGIGHANHTQIAAAAGVSLPSVFHYFPTSEDLTRAVLEDVAEFLLEGIALRSMASAETGLAGLEATLEALATSFDANIALIAIWLDWSTAAGGPYWDSYLDFHQRACGIVGPLAAKALKESSGEAPICSQVERASRIVVGLAHLVAQMRLLRRPVAEIAEETARLLRGYFRS